MTTALSFLSGRQITNDNGTPQAGAKLYIYREGTTTALTVWTDDAASVAHANPIVCDAGGFVPLIYVDDTFDYKVVIKTSADVTLKTYDNIPAPDPSSTTGFFPTLLTWVTKTSAQSPVALTAADAGNAYETDTTSGNVTFNLPAAASIGNGKGFTFKKLIAANSMIIDPNGSETIDDSSISVTVTRQYDVVHIVSDGAEWFITDRYDPFVGSANGTIVRSMIGGANALVITNNSGTPNTQVDVNADDAFLVNTSGNGIRTGTVDLTINAGTTGANGLDTGSLGNSLWYYIWLISNGVTTAALLSLSATAPAMPSGYTYKYLVGEIFTNGSAAFVRIRKKGNVTRYQVIAASTTPNLPIINSSATGSITVPTWTAFSVSNFVPPTATHIQLLMGTNTSTNIILAPNNSYGAINSTTNPPYWQHITGSAGFIDMMLESTNIYIAQDSSSAGVTACVGWIDAVNAS